MVQRGKAHDTRHDTNTTRHDTARHTDARVHDHGYDTRYGKRTQEIRCDKCKENCNKTVRHYLEVVRTLEYVSDGGGYGLIWPSLVDTKFRVTRETQPQRDTKNRLIGILLTRDRLVRVRRDARICFTRVTAHTTPRIFYLITSLPYHPVVFDTRSTAFLRSLLLATVLWQTVGRHFCPSHTIPFNPSVGTFLAGSPSLLSPLYRSPSSSFSSGTARGILRTQHSRFRLSTASSSLRRVLVRADRRNRGTIRMITYFSRFSRT